ncbi:DUF4097 family beta strand repeat-containing protein [Amycolatopsis cynarae]|uniref:DUF4097 family beta strand repeat-containing protein n=1 Tax=Amycolatopsis cynarae TaxID=2995223 RepID=A0ABY7AZX9_9PSEU|nr:DUF4097 family beta strand repeat-containing protein [Amycolatopsis sp. HUAS 11-8]WAL65595.1 DUF4097 family beta strand repeat-containing protein [Amycolatopsis sp. HUAS 11-8]
MRTLTHTSSGPVQAMVEADSAVTVEVHAEERHTAEVTLEPVDPRDAETARLIENATAESRGKRFVVRVPRNGAGGNSMTVIRSGGSVIVSGGTVTGSVTGMVIGSGVTIVNGQVIGGQGTTIINGGRGMRVIVRLPLGSEIEVATQSGDVTTHGPLPRVETSSVSGDVRIERAEVAEVRTTSGDVRIASADAVRVNAVSGDVTVRALAGRAEVRTVSGDITVHAVRASIVRAAAVSGDVTVTADAGVEVDADTRTVSGRTRNRRGW